MIEYGLEWHSLAGYFQFKEMTAPAAPETNHARLYAKDKAGVSALYYKNDAGTEFDLSLVGGALVTGTGAATRLAFWSSASVITSDADLTFVTDTLTATKIVAPTSLTLSAITIGSLLFAGTAGIVSADVATAFWDNTNKRLAIGGNIAPLGKLDIQSSSAADGFLVMRQATADVNGPAIAMLKARGSIGSEGTTQSGDSIGIFSFGGYANGAWQFNNATMRGFAGSLWSSTNEETYIVFETTPSASVTRAERFRIGSAGQWGIGGATFGTAGQYFRSAGIAAAPAWATISDADLGSVFALLAGRSGGQTLIGGTAAADDLILRATSGVGAGSETILFQVGSNGALEALRVGQANSQSVVAIGTAVLDITNASTLEPRLIISGSGVNHSAQVIRHTTVGGGGGIFTLSATRGAEANTHTSGALQAADGIGSLLFAGSDGTRFLTAASIVSVVATTFTTDTAIATMNFNVNDGTSVSTPPTGMSLDSGGILTVGKSASLARLRLSGFYTASPADPPTNQTDIIMIDTGVAYVLRVRYNDAGVMRVGDIALI